MAYCTNCGCEVEAGSKFCRNCGASQTRRKIIYDGEVHKCPNCGATLVAFVKNCPDCGYELRGANSTRSLQEFNRIYATLNTNVKMVDLIRTFAIPNTKEDILEFVFLAASNVNVRSYSRKKQMIQMEYQNMMLQRHGWPN